MGLGSACLSRRGFLRRTVDTAALLGAPALMAACSASPSTPSAPASTPVRSTAVKPVTLQAYQPPANLPAPDFTGSAAGVVEPGFVNWPKTTYQSVKQAPGDGSEVSIFLNLPGAPPPAVDQNPAWQAWNKALNVKLTFQFFSPSPTWHPSSAR